MDKKNKVSIITTVRNEERTIGILLDALLSQTFEFEELVINDNGSTDNTVNRIKSYQEKHDKIKLIRSEGKSIGEGRNSAIENSFGDILAIMDAGICPKVDWLEKIVNPLLEDPEIDVAWGHIFYDTKSRIIPLSDLAVALVFLTKYPERRMGRKNIPSSAFRRRVWNKLDGFPTIQFPIEDILLRYLIDNRGFKVTFVDDAIAYYFSYPASQYEVFRKWITSACSVFLTRKAAIGFYKRLVKFGLFFLFFPLIFVDIRFLSLIIIYILVFFTDRYRLNKEVGKRIFSNPKLLITTLYLFFILNFARLIGIIKALLLVASGKRPKNIYKYTYREVK